MGKGVHDLLLHNRSWGGLLEKNYLKNNMRTVTIGVGIFLWRSGNSLTDFL
jgi:hypothetical protein